MDQKKLQGPWRTKVFYHRLMLPNWLRSSDKVEWNSPKEGVDLNLVILPDSSDWEKIFRVPLIPKGRVGRRGGHHSQNESGSHIVWRVIVWASKATRSYALYDLRCLSDWYATARPKPRLYYGSLQTSGGWIPKEKVESGYYSNVLVSTTLQKIPISLSWRSNNPRRLGSAYCAIDNGHKVVTQYCDTLKLSKGLKFELYRYQSTERYTINYVEITVYLDSKPV